MANEMTQLAGAVAGALKDLKVTAAERAEIMAAAQAAWGAIRAGTSLKTVASMMWLRLRSVCTWATVITLAIAVYGAAKGWMDSRAKSQAEATLTNAAPSTNDTGLEGPESIYAELSLIARDAGEAQARQVAGTLLDDPVEVGAAAKSLGLENSNGRTWAQLSMSQPLERVLLAAANGLWRGVMARRVLVTDDRPKSIIDAGMDTEGEARQEKSIRYAKTLARTCVKLGISLDDFVALREVLAWEDEALEELRPLVRLVAPSVVA